MVGSIASSPAIDLSGLPAPLIIDQPDFETRLAAKLASMIAQYPAFSALVESDPAIKLLEADSYDETVLAQAVADAARSVLLAYASGPTLDHIGALFGVERQTVTPADPDAGTDAVMESDTAFKQRIQLAPHSFSVAGPELAYVYHARSADPDVGDASADTPAPGEVVVTIMSASGDGIPTAPVLAAVTDLLAGPVRPMTDLVTVQAVALVDFVVEAQLYVFAGPDQTLILQTALDALNAHLATLRRLDRDITRSAIIAALHVANVVNVDLIAPAADVIISKAQVGRCTAIDVTVAGTEL